MICSSSDKLRLPCVEAGCTQTLSCSAALTRHLQYIHGYPMVRGEGASRPKPPEATSSELPPAFLLVMFRLVSCLQTTNLNLDVQGLLKPLSRRLPPQVVLNLLRCPPWRPLLLESDRSGQDDGGAGWDALGMHFNQLYICGPLRDSDRGL